LDPEPVQKWAEEGFAVAGVTLSSSEDFDQKSITSALKQGINGLLQLTALDTKDKFGVIGMPHLREICSNPCSNFIV
jgi:carboxymethylenebutenolidase